MTGRVNSIDAFCLGFGEWVEDELDDRLQLAVLEAEGEWREGSWDALAVVLDHYEDGELVLPEDPADLARLFLALRRLDWIGPAPDGGGEG